LKDPTFLAKNPEGWITGNCSKVPKSPEIAQLQMCSLLVKPLQLLLLLQSLEACRWMFGTCFCGTLLAAGVQLKELMKSGRKCNICLHLLELISSSNCCLKLNHAQAVKLK
jgi:hypothetical protein